jgi:hypothetical protein
MSNKSTLPIQDVPYKNIFYSFEAVRKLIDIRCSSLVKDVATWHKEKWGGFK